MPEPRVWTNVDGDPTTYDRISVTEIRELGRCTRKHLYGYRQGLRPAVTPGYFSKGKYLHELLASGFRAYAETQGLDGPSNLWERGLQLYAAAPAEGTVDLPPSDVQAEVQASVREYLSNIGTDFVVMGVEQEFYVDLGWTNERGDPVLLYGFVDAIIRGKDEDAPIWIVEHKSASRAWSLGQFLFDYQTRLYSAAVRLLTGEDVQGALFQFFYPKRHETKALYSTPDEEARLIAEVQEVIRLRDSGLVTRQPHWGCNDCGFRNLCHAELIGADAAAIRESEFTVDQDKVDRFAEE